MKNIYSIVLLVAVMSAMSFAGQKRLVAEIVPNSFVLYEVALNKAAVMQVDLAGKENLTFDEVRNYATAQMDMFKALKQCKQENYKAIDAFETIDPYQSDAACSMAMRAMRQRAQISLSVATNEERNNPALVVDTVQRQVMGQMDLCNEAIKNALLIHNLCDYMNHYEAQGPKGVEYRSPNNLLKLLQENLNTRAELFGL